MRALKARIPYDNTLNGYPVPFDISGANLSVTSGTAYTFLITSVTGSGDLGSRGIMVNSDNPYAGGRAYEGAYSVDLPNDDLAFRTQVAVPEPASAAPLGAGALALLAVRRRAKAA